MSQPIDISIVICTLNGARRISPCIESLLAQTYPAARLEIIVVDDGSTDNTGQVVADFGLRLIKHAKNQGIPFARNTGIRYAKGRIVAFIDDDCIASPNWAEGIMAQFDQPKVGAAGGRVDAHETKFFSQRYLLAAGYGNPASIEFGKSTNPISRFLVYLKTMLKPTFLSKQPIEVQSAYTANVAYRASVLKEVGGFDVALLSDEDTALSSQIRRQGYDIMFVPSVSIKHRHHEKISDFISQTYRRARNTYLFYSKTGKIPPIFPMPFAAILATFLAGLIHPLALLSAVVFVQLAYFWWIYRAIKEQKVEYLLYPYIQFTIEMASIFGLAKGWQLAHNQHK